MSAPPWSAEELAAALALCQADRDLARGERRLARALERLPASPRDQDPEDLEAEAEPDVQMRLRVAAHCALEHLLPARRALQEPRETLRRLPLFREVARGTPPVPPSSHAAFRHLLADLRPTHLAGLRHWLVCPLCQALARLLLGDLPGESRPPPSGKG